MPVAPTNRTAALAGAWCAIGFIPYDAWQENQSAASVATGNVAFLVFLAVFLVVPAYFFVLGHGSQPFSGDWLWQSEERARYSVVVKRMLSWFLAAAAVMALSSFFSG